MKKNHIIKKKICFVSLNAYPLLSKIDKGYVGGAELQQVLIGNELHKRGYDITFLTYKEFDEAEKIIDGIRIIPTYARNQVQNLHYFKKVLIILFQIKKVDANIFIYKCGCPGIITFISKIKKFKIIKILASDLELNGLSILNNIKNINFFSFLRWFDLRFSDMVVSQNIFQKKSLEKKLGIKSTLIKNPIDLVKTEKKNSNFILWVGTIRKVKQPELFLKLAKELPNLNFIMVGGIGESRNFYKYIESEAKSINNLDFKGFISHKDIFYYYQNALFIVNTSLVEGFPNIFLEAWMNFKPVVSLNVDPDDIIKKFNLGFHSKNFDVLVNNVIELCNNHEMRYEMGENANRYVENNHNIEKIVNLYEDIFERLF